MAQNGTDRFGGAKVLVFMGERLLVIRRDLRDDIPWPGALDLPGGGREGDESPERCALRETEEEVGLVLSEADLSWRALHLSATLRSWFFAARLPPERVRDVRLGDEGTEWLLIDPGALLRRTDTIPHHMAMLERYLAETHCT
ncbi:NUDIX domain-containing protein [Roseivivax isoporae]|uniref:Nudix hydrolase domain-containing protein n=1 Tax=Roseivivax isoporae LMG 25204 TaxID=1449351 RepID=X7F4X3_9RHOB|nr:NUDIX domain-containing protein [Roseivivax isoporae]ETX27099.1 hypothetical protein RISW2_16660 [Roseivivax isoporae LMG 25204]